MIAYLWVAVGGALPTPDGCVQMYPCYSFEFHLMLVSIDPELGKPEIERYVVGHDCGTVINPKIVRGMTMGGIAHGIGAALYEEFSYNDDGFLMALEGIEDVAADETYFDVVRVYFLQAFEHFEGFLVFAREA